MAHQVWKDRCESYLIFLSLPKPVGEGRLTWFCESTYSCILVVISQLILLSIFKPYQVSKFAAPAALGVFWTLSFLLLLGATQIIMCVKTGSDMPDIVVLTVFVSNQSKEGVGFRKCSVPRKSSGALKPREKSRASKGLPEATKVRGRNAHLSLN